MKKIVSLCAVALTLLLTGCLEITDEITLKEDGSGVMTSTTDMSMLVSMMKNMGGTDAPGADKVTDTTISLSNLVDSISSLTTDEKNLMKNGQVGFIFNMADEKMLTRLEIPFSTPEEAGRIKGIAAKISNYVISEKASGSMPPGMGEKMPGLDPISGYFVTTFSNGVIEKKLNKEKYAGLDKDESMSTVKEMANNGMGLSSTTVLNLPRPAKSATGKGVTLSEDKKKVTIKGSVEDFFDNAAGMEFRIEY